MGIDFWFGNMKRFWRLLYNSVNILNTSELPVHLKLVKMVSFMLKHHHVPP